VARKIQGGLHRASVSDRNVQALFEGCKHEGHAVGIGGELFSDSMGKPGTPEGTYVGMVRHNVDVIAESTALERSQIMQPRTNRRRVLRLPKTAAPRRFSMFTT
jgi:hypothetical protein